MTKNILRSKSVFNLLTKRHFNEISAQTIIDPTFGLSDEDKQLQEGKLAKKSFYSNLLDKIDLVQFLLIISFQILVAYNFAIKELRPNMRNWDASKHFPVDEMRRAAGLGFGAMYCKEKYGGTGLSRLQTSLIIEGN